MEIETMLPATLKLENNHWMILKTIKSKGVSYISELAWDLHLTEYLVKDLLSDLVTHEYAEEIKADYFNPDPRLVARVPEMSARGQGGYSQFCRKRWFTLTKKGKEVVARAESR